jgi:hypothetical protein
MCRLSGAPIPLSYCVMSYPPGGAGLSTPMLLGVSFYIIARPSSPPSLLTDATATLQASLDNGVLLQVLVSLGRLSNCTLREEVSEWMSGREVDVRVD